MVCRKREATGWGWFVRLPPQGATSLSDSAPNCVGVLSVVGSGAQGLVWVVHVVLESDAVGGFCISISAAGRALPHVLTQGQGGMHKEGG